MADYSSPFGGLFSSAAQQNGIDPGLLNVFARIESGGNPNAKTGSYSGLFQLSPNEFNKYGGGNIFDPADNTNAAARKLANEASSFKTTYGRDPTPVDLYLIHQQGQGGYAAHTANPDAPAWQNMYSTAEGRQKGPEWAKRAIWGNVPDDVKVQYPGGVDSLTSKQFMDLWANKVARFGGDGQKAMASMTGGFGIPANFDPNDPTSAMFAPPPAGIGGAQTPLPNPGGPVPINLPQPPNMRYSKLADALLGSAAGAQPTGWGSLLNALGDAGLGYTMANKADTRQREYQSALAQALGSAKTPEDITAAMIASGNPEMMNQGVAARMATLSPKAKKDRFLVTPNGVFDLETSQMVQGTSKEQPDDTITVNGRVLHRDASGKYSEVYNVPPQLQATDRKEIFESDAAAQAGNSAIITLKKALDLNKKAYSGPAAQTRGYVSSLFGTEGGQATEDLNNLVTAQALDQLKATFGAAPTEGERKILLDIQGSTSQAPAVREKIWKRAIDMAQRRVDFNKEQAKGLRSGTYFQPGYSPVTPNQSPQPDQPANQPQQRYKFNPETGELE